MPVSSPSALRTITVWPLATPTRAGAVRGGRLPRWLGLPYSGTGRWRERRYRTKELVEGDRNNRTGGGRVG